MNVPIRPLLTLRASQTRRALHADKFYLFTPSPAQALGFGTGGLIRKVSPAPKSRSTPAVMKLESKLPL